nr:MAG: ORF1 [TTV-like mini virus]
MPYYRWRPRRRRFWRRRPRTYFRRRFWRRRRRWVRKPKRKLTKIKITQWQPETIRKLKITGELPLYEGTRERTTNNMTQWLESTAPYRVPGGGLWSMHRISLESLYKQHQKARNWWTNSNCNLPLIRYTGCKFKLHRSVNTDYIFVWANCGDMTATEKLYQSTQPSILMLNRKKKIVTCDDGKRNKKEYKVVKIRPPAMLENKWYFQKDLAPIPLVMFLTSAASLSRFYLGARAESNTMGFTSLNTDFFQFHNFKSPSLTTGYRPNSEFYIYTYRGNYTDVKDIPWGDLIYLGNSKDYQGGHSINQMSGEHKFRQYFSKITNWGNIFYGPNFSADRILVTKIQTPAILAQMTDDKLTEKIRDMQFTSQPLTWDCRYNPEADISHNAIFISPITEVNPTPWQQPHEDRLITEGLPLWLLLHGWTDYHAKANDIQRLMTDNIVAIISDYIEPYRHTYYVPLDKDFLNGQSPYQNQHRKDYDEQYWHPKLNFQQRSLNEIVNVGPAAPKLPPDTSTEAHVTYTFYFKLGGCPPPMDDVCDPATRGKYPTPSNILSTTLLQNPQTPIEYYLSRFDERRGQLTATAAKRIKKDYDSKDTMFQPTGQASTEVPLREIETPSDETSEEEKDPQEIQLNIKRQRKLQRKLRHRLLELLQLTQE